MIFQSYNLIAFFSFTELDASQTTATALPEAESGHPHPPTHGQEISCQEDRCNHCTPVCSSSLAGQAICSQDALSGTQTTGKFSTRCLIQLQVITSNLINYQWFSRVFHDYIQSKIEKNKKQTFIIRIITNTYIAHLITVRNINALYKHLWVLIPTCSLSKKICKTSMEVLKINKVIIVKLNGSLWWQTMKLLNSLLQCSVWMMNIQFSSKRVWKMLLERREENMGYSYFLSSLFQTKILSSKTFTVFSWCQKPPAQEMSTRSIFRNPSIFIQSTLPKSNLLGLNK